MSLPPQPPKAKPVDSGKAVAEAAKSDLDGELAAKKENVDKLKQDLSESQGELVALEEKNHQLRLMLAEVKNEVGSLKDELGDENRIRTEVEKLLEEERLKAEEAAAMAPSQLDKLLANTWVVVLLALIPGLLLVLIIVLILTRRSAGAQQEDELVSGQPEVISLVDDEVPEINLDDDLEDGVAIADDLFGEQSDQNVFDIEDDAEQGEEEDVFAGLDDNDLDFNLDDGDEDPFASIGDNGDFDTDLEQLDGSSNGISVDGDEKALSLEEMERALDEETKDLSDEVESEFNLAGEGEISQEDLEELLASDEDEEPLDGDSLDQSVLDDLFNNVADSGSDEQGGDVDFDSLLSTDDGLDDFDLSDDQDDAGLSGESTDLLDELISEQDSDIGDIRIDEDSTDLLDELLEDEPSTDPDDPAGGVWS